MALGSPPAIQMKFVKVNKRKGAAVQLFCACHLLVSIGMQFAPSHICAYVNVSVVLCTQFVRIMTLRLR